MESTSSSQFRSSSSPVLLSCDITNPDYIQSYNQINKSWNLYTIILPDCAQIRFEDSKSEPEDSDSSSVFEQDNLAMKVKTLEIKLNSMQTEHNCYKEKMLHLTKL